MKNGFTFLELIIAIFVLTVGILGAFFAAQYPLSQTQVSISKLRAAYLAQEGIELVRNIRDENWVNSRFWDTGLNICGAATKCQIDYNDSGLSPYVAGNYLKIDSNGFYNYASGSDTIFTRKITITSVDDPLGGDNPDYLKILVSVDWSQKGKPYNVEVQENLYPWWSY